MKTLLAFVFLGAVAAAQDPMAGALGKGIIEQDTNHNIDAAIRIYEAAIQQRDAEHAAAAAVLFRMAECYRAQGKNETATAFYGRVVREFGDQTEFVERAKKFLADTPAEAAAQEYRKLLQQEIDLAREQSKLVRSAAAAASTQEREERTAEAELEVLALEREAAAFDARLLPRQPPVPASTEAAEARRRYRSLLEQEAQQAELLASARVGQNISKARIQALSDNLAREQQKIRSRRILAAFDAGLAVDEVGAFNPNRNIGPVGLVTGRQP